MIPMGVWAADEGSFSERLAVAMVGPLISALVGTGAIGLFLWWLGRRAETSREARVERATALERHRAQQDRDAALRHGLVTRLLDSATALYLATQHYARVLDDPSLADRLPAARTALDGQYLRSRKAASLLEIELSIHYATEAPALASHRIDDLLTVRYMQLIGRADHEDRIYTINALGTDGKEHSGLTVAQLKDSALLLEAYQSAVRQAAEILLTAPLRAGSRAPARAGDTSL